MAYEEIDIQRLRADLELPADRPGNDQLGDLFTRADLVYATNTNARNSYVRVLCIRQLMMAAAKRPDYVANMFQLKASQIFPALEKMLGIWNSDLDYQLTASGSLTSVMGLPFASQPPLTEKPYDESYNPYFLNG